MPSEYPKEARLRLDRFSGVLRRFGLVDRYEIGAKLSLSASITLPKLKRLLAPFDGALPNGVDVEFLARLVHSALSEVTPETEAWRERFASISPQFDSIDTGRKHASKYHKHAFDLLKAIFDGFLTNGRIEQEINTGIQRIDLMFDNMTGIFSQLASKIGKPSPYLPIECKNYTNDLGTPEYDQLSGRLNPRIGPIGVLVFRSITDWNHANQHCQAKLKDSKYLILLDDSDLVAMYQKRHKGNISGMEGVILDRFRSLMLNVAAK